MTQYKYIDGQAIELTPAEEADLAAAQAAYNAPEAVAARAREAIPPITKRQFLIAAANAGIITWDEAGSTAVPVAIQAIFDALPDPQDKAAKVTWIHMTKIGRNEPLVVAAATSFGMTEEQVNNFFIQAAAI